MVLKYINGSMLDCLYFIYFGLIWDIFEGEYVMGIIYFIIS